MSQRRPTPSPTVEEPVRLREVWAAARARRKALRAEVRRFTGRQRRRRLLWLGGAASVVAPRARHARRGLQPAVRRRADPCRRRAAARRAAVEAALTDQLGTPLPLVDESAVKAALVDVPARGVVLARGATAARAGRAHRRAHSHRPDPDARRATRSSTPPVSPCRRPRHPPPGRPLAHGRGRHRTRRPSRRSGRSCGRCRMRSATQVTAVVGLDAGRRDPDARRRERAGRVGERRGLRDEGARPREGDGGPSAGVGQRLRRVVAERDRRALTWLARAFRAVPGRMSRHAATLPAGAVASAYFRDQGNCIPGNSLYLY